ncbi:organic solute transporter Ostalpha-domain-containing protein [Chlamydoabsidia padenii]|nr:organic solute transporter Ostalpha-domain-containing protein [Chlamydoabsidia padenii]
MVPVYGISTFISLISLDTAFYVDTFRDIYEAFVIYAFFNLLVNKLGGERALIIMLHSRPPTENFFPGTLYSRNIFVGDPYTFLFVKRGILQFVYVKPVLAFVTMALKATGNYHDGDISWSSSYLYLTFLYNLTVCLGLWCLMVLFYATKQDLMEFRPLPKFLCVKAIIFFSFWQSVIIAILVSCGAIHDDGTGHTSVAIQDFLICMEMVPFAVAHLFAFSYNDYYDMKFHSARMPILTAVKDSIGLKDVLMDTLDTFRGSKFNYKSFEPSEGVPHFGSSRNSRIMAGVRYSTSNSTKRWLGPAPVSKFLTTGRGINDEVVLEESELLAFTDPSSDDSDEECYTASRSMQFGDYNYPVIGFHSPHHGSHIKKTRQQKVYGGTWSSRNRYLPIEQREGCMDVIVEEGKGNYVVLDYSSFESDTSRLLQHQPTIQISRSTPSPYHHQSVIESSALLVSSIPTTTCTSLASSSSSLTASISTSTPSTILHQVYQTPSVTRHQLSNYGQHLQRGADQSQTIMTRQNQQQQDPDNNTLTANYDQVDDRSSEQDGIFTTSNVWK